MCQYDWYEEKYEEVSYFSMERKGGPLYQVRIPKQFL